MMQNPDFNPPWWLGNRHLQSVLGSIPPRKTWLHWRARNFIAAAREQIVDCGDGVRLLARIDEPRESNGEVVVMIHGWEGHADSGYMISVAPLLVEEGYTVVRLNLRDHGDSHHLNRELFHSCRLPEVVGAVRWVSQAMPDKRLSLVGFSLGGNFCLRVGAEAPRAGLTIERIVAVCPVLNPAQTMAALDSGWSAYRNFFIKKWRRSLLKKVAAFPGEFEFGDLGRFTSLQSMTDFLITTYSEYDDLQVYLRGYALINERLAELNSSGVMLLAADDPVIPIAGLPDVYVPDSLEVHHLPRGGHVGFMDNLAARSWLDNYVLQQLQSSGR